MSILATKSTAGATLVLLACACAGNARNVEVAETSPTATATAATTQPSALSDPVASAEDVALMRDFVAFAMQPSAKTAAALPLAAKVRLGLGPDLMVTLDESEFARASAWVLEAESFRAYIGPFSALDLVQRNAEKSGPKAVSMPGGALDVSVGDHSHCASPPVAAPQSLEGYRRVSVQPTKGSIDSCLMWFTVDLFLDTDGRIAAVTLDVWEP